MLRSTVTALSGRLVLVAVTLGTMLLVGPVASASASGPAGQAIVQLRDQTPVSSYAGMVAFSQRDSSGAFRLMVLRASATSVVPVASSHVPFDVDLGPGPRGGVSAVYSRCAVDPPLVAFFDNWTVGHVRGCRIYRFDFDTGRELLVPGTHQAGASEYLPTIWKQNIAFARSPKSSIAGPQLWERRQGARAVRLHAGPASVCKGSGGGRQCASGYPQQTPLSLDLRGDKLAFSWRMPDFAEGQAHEIRIVRPGRPSELIQHTGGGGLSDAFVAWPVFDGPVLYYARACFGDPGGCAHRYNVTRYDPRSGARTTLPLPSRSTLWFTHTAAQSFTLIAPLPTSGACTTDEPGARPTCELRTT